MSRTERQRDLYLALLGLHEQTEIEPFLDRVLALAREATGARVVYLAIGPGADGRAPRWWRAHALDEPALVAIRERISTTLLREAMAQGVVHTTSARNDARFHDRASVQRFSIDAVVCAAIGVPAGGRPLGVIYLQGQEPHGWFSDEAIADVGVLARHLGPTAQRLVSNLRLDGPDPTLPWRRRLRADALVGHSAALARVLEALTVASAAPIPVLLTGPTGTGKTTVARVLHDSSPHARGRFVEVNAAQLVPERALADLFGARSGAYTGLREDRVGLVEEARGGTLFLDEITQLDQQVQAQLLTFLQDGTFRRLGDTRVRKAEGVRLVAATNDDPEAAARSGRFREDLLYRISGLRIPLPPLSARAEDLPLLAHSLIERVAARYGIPSRPLSASAHAWLASREWPGNVRELDHALQRGLLWAHADEAPAIRLEHLERPESPAAPLREAPSLKAAVHAFRCSYARRVLADCGGNKAAAARQLGIHRSHLYELLEP